MTVPVPNPVYPLCEVISRLQAVIDSLDIQRPSINPHIDMAIAYMQVLANAELQLRDRFIGGDLVWPGLMSPRALQAADHKMTTPLLVNAEVAFQRDRLERVAADLVRLQKTLIVSPDEDIVVPDTNVFLHGDPLDQIDWTLVVTKPRTRIVIPHIVLDELDRHTHSHQKTLAKQARLSMQLIDKLRGEAAGPSDVVAVSDHASMQLLADPPLHVRLSSNDAEFMLRAQFVHALAGQKPTVLTIDRGMIVRAHIHGLDSSRAQRRVTE